MNISNKKVLITGADGFIGSHLVECLLAAGCAVKAFVYYNSFNSWGWLDTFASEKLKNIEIFSGDIRDPNGVRSAVKGADIVFHLAALIGIPFSYHSPDSYIDTNVKGTLNILQSARDLKVSKIIVTSTSEVYGTSEYVPIDEKHPLKGQSPYSATKIGADALADSFYRSFDLPIVIARPFNTYGPRQSARAIIPTIITQILSGAKEIKLGALSPTRDLNYVLDTCSGFVSLAECDSVCGRAINIGSGTEISMGDLFQLIKRFIGADVKVISEDARKRAEKSEVERLIANNTVIKTLTPWRPKFSLEDGLKETIKWFRDKKNLERYKHDIYNV
ncbi:nucleotide sugar dehydratase [Candidatus Omnitrophus magneticus]|uniref:Nucleotide sugar dehydratase n=1 Tax=Candidatus Omnitrophus magneticus TaxID=1609969 RepID=A0A0F0CU31_9BACT|nr:nucleotide sugar dehydratase [Candidatus Omnitrophus magneticus]